MKAKCAALLVGGLLYGLLQSSAIAFDVSTYHYDALRTGWNNQETSLTPANVKGAGGPTGTGLRLLSTIPLDDRVNAQPLLITNQSISNVGVRDVVYVATANNTVYAIDATTGAVLLTRNFGQPVAGCGPWGAPLGILSTPVIDTQAKVMYLVTETLEDGDIIEAVVDGHVITTDPDPDPGNLQQDPASVRVRIDLPQISVPGNPGGPHSTGHVLIPRIPVGKHPEYKIHAIDLGTLADKLPPKVVSASHQLKDGKVYKFSALYSRQRPALVYANGSVYAAFSAACEQGDRSRGWLLGWNAATLAQLSSNELTNTLEPYPFSPPVWYLSGIWMSGFGVAADDSGNLFFVTGNSGPKTYGAPNNFSESVMKVSGDLTRVIGYFTPANVNDLDGTDSDFGSGGVLLLPDQPGSKPHLAVAAGKVARHIGTLPGRDDTPLFLLDRDNLGGFTSPTNNALAEYFIGGCLCGPSYFVGSDSTPRIVSSGGNEVITWKVQTDPAPALVKEHVAAVDPQRNGFFTTVSSNGLTPDTAVIWAVHSNPPTLSAFDASTGLKINSWPAGSWRQHIGLSSVVPVVANGKVYVATDRQLSIFGLGAPSHVTQSSPLPPLIMENPNVVVGEVRSLDGSRIILATPEGSETQVDASNAVENHLSIPFTVGSRITVEGQRDENGIMRANIIIYPEPF